MSEELRRLRDIAIDKAQLEALRQNLRRKCRESLWFFAYHCCGYKDIDTELHRKMCLTWQLRWLWNKSLWLIPRGHLKTSIWTVAGTLWGALHQRDWRWLICSADSKLSEAMLLDIKNIILGSESFRWLFPEYCYDLAEDSLRRRCIIRRDRIDFPCSIRVGAKEGSITAGSSEADLTGHHYDVLHYDDIIYEKNSQTMDLLDKMWDWFRNQEQLVDSPKSIFHYVGTRWHYADVAGRILKSEDAYRKEQRENGVMVPQPEWKIFRLACWVMEDGKFKLDSNNERVSIWPERWTNQALEAKKRSVGSAIFACQMLNEPVPEEDAIFKRSDIKRIDSLYLPESLVTFITVDLADDESIRGDWIVATVASFDQEGKMYVREMTRTRTMSVLNFCEEIWRLTKKWKPMRVGVETSAFQRVIYRHYQHEAAKQGWNIPWSELKRGAESKYKRILGLQARVERGDFVICDTVRDSEAIEDEMTFFPKAQHDDILDTLADLERLYFKAPQVHREVPEEPYSFDSIASMLDSVGGNQIRDLSIGAFL